MARAETSDGALPIPERYLDEAAKPETEATLRERLPQKLRQIGDGRLVKLAREAYGYVRHPGVSRGTKLMGAGALLYLIAPFDAVSDLIPGLGYVDDAAVLTAFVMSVRNATMEVVEHTQQAANEVVSHAISEAREAWARRGVSQVCLSLWGATLAACVGLLYYGIRRALHGGESGVVPTDPFFWACMLAGALGLAYQLVFGARVWNRYRNARPEIKEPLAYAIVSLADWRQTLLLALPVLALMALLALRAAWTLQS
jgi:uncharacterized membrane protein YkvA (DUF1232 family)